MWDYEDNLCKLYTDSYVYQVYFHGKKSDNSKYDLLFALYFMKQCNLEPTLISTVPNIFACVIYIILLM